MVFTTRLSGGKGGRNGLETEQRRVGVIQKNSRPNHPTTCGKVERVQQTMKNWLRAQPAQPTTIAELQMLLDAFVTTYNHHRPHRALPHRATPAAVYTTRPKATPRGGRQHDTHDRGPPRHRRHRRHRHPARPRPPAPHRPRPNPRSNPRHPAHPGPTRPSHPRHHRRTPPRADPRPSEGLPADRPDPRPKTQRPEPQ
jgi:Integrase core domain